MPAIQPARLKQQAALLAESFDRPAAFVRSLHHLLEFYSDRVHRAGTAGKPPPLLSSYHIRPPVLRQVLQELIPLARNNPAEALTLCAALWEQPNLEFRLLAVSLLGQVPAALQDQVVQQVESWLRKHPEQRLTTVIVQQGLAQVRQNSAAGLIETAERWLADEDLFLQQAGLSALVPLAEEESFRNLPVLFRVIQPYVRSTSPRLRPFVLDLIAALARRTPQETAFFLRKCLELPQNPDTAWFVRQSLLAFPESLQETLRSAARQYERHKNE